MFGKLIEVLGYFVSCEDAENKEWLKQIPGTACNMLG